jgi:hypothetical protein
MKHFNCNKKIVLALLCALTTLSVVSGINTKNTKQLRGSIDDNNVRVLHVSNLTHESSTVETNIEKAYIIYVCTNLRARLQFLFIQS